MWKPLRTKPTYVKKKKKKKTNPVNPEDSSTNSSTLNTPCRNGVPFPPLKAVYAIILRLMGDHWGWGCHLGQDATRCHSRSLCPAFNSSLDHFPLSVGSCAWSPQVSVSDGQVRAKCSHPLTCFPAVPGTPGPPHSFIDSRRITKGWLYLRH